MKFKLPINLTFRDQTIKKFVKLKRTLHLHLQVDDNYLLNPSPFKKQ